MELLLVLLVSYLIFGAIYAFYISSMGIDNWSAFPINTLGGPIIVIYNYIQAKRGKLGPKRRKNV